MAVLRKSFILFVSVLLYFSYVYFEKPIYKFLGLTHSYLLWNIVSNTFLILVSLLVMRMIGKERIKRPQVLFESSPLKKAIIYLAMLAIFGAVSITSAKYVEAHFQAGHYKAANIAEKVANSPHVELSVYLEIFKRLVTTAMSAIEEEVFFRWLLLGTLLTFQKPRHAIALSAFIFAIAHLFNPLAEYQDLGRAIAFAVPTFTLGLFFGLVYWREGIIWSIPFHFYVNLFPAFGNESWPRYLSVVLLISLLISPFIIWKQFRPSAPQ